MDFLTDPNPVALHRYIRSELPEEWFMETLAKEASSPATVVFADAVNNEYPLHDPAFAIAGGIHHHFLLPEQRQPHHSQIGENIKKAAAWWQVEDQIDEAIAYLEAQRQKQASNKQPKYAFVHEGVGYWPINNYLEVLGSAKEIATRIRHRDLPDAVLHKAASEIVASAPEHGVESQQLPWPVLSLGTPKALSFEKAAKRVAHRAQVIPEEAVAVYGEIVKAAAAEPEELEKYIELMEELDSHYKVAYSILQPSPREMFFGSDMKDVEESLDQVVITHSGVPVPSELFKIAVARMESQLENYFLHEQAEAIRKVASTKRGLDMTRLLNEGLSPDAQDRLVQRVILIMQ